MLSGLLGALAIGAMIVVQPAVNAQLARAFGSPILAAIISFIAGLLALIAIALILRVPMPTATAIRSVPAHAWVAGGLLGALFVFGTTLLAPRLGSALMTALIVTGQLSCAVLLDHFGAIGLPHHPISIERVAGIALIIAGAFLVARG